MHDRIDDCSAADQASDLSDLIADWAISGSSLRNVDTKAILDRAPRGLERHDQTAAATASGRQPYLDLPDLANFEDRFGRAVAASAGSGRPFCVLWIDFDGFEGVKDASRTALLRLAAERLRIAAHGSCVDRIGGDAFAIILDDECQPAASETLVRRLRTAFDDPLLIDGRAFDTVLSIGVAIHPIDRRFPAGAVAAR